MVTGADVVGKITGGTMSNGAPLVVVVVCGAGVVGGNVAMFGPRVTTKADGVILCMGFRM
jgi:hypothetical protein